MLRRGMGEIHFDVFERSLVESALARPHHEVMQAFYVSWLIPDDSWLSWLGKLKGLRTVVCRISQVNDDLYSIAEDQNYFSWHFLYREQLLVLEYL